MVVAPIWYGPDNNEWAVILDQNIVSGIFKIPHYYVSKKQERVILVARGRAAGLLLKKTGLPINSARAPPALAGGWRRK